MFEPTFSPPLHPTLMKVVMFFWRLAIGMVVFISVAIFCGILAINQYEFEKQYSYTKMQWHTKVLPSEEIMTISFDTSDKEFNYGFKQNQFILSGFYGNKLSKMLPFDGISNQVVYLDQANIPESIKSEVSYVTNNVTLLVADEKNAFGYPLIFLKEATIKRVDENWNRILESKKNIGKQIITGTDFNKNRALIEKAFFWNLTCNNILVGCILLALGFIFYRFRQKLNLFEKGLLILVVIELTAYLSFNSKAYFSTLL